MKRIISVLISVTLVFSVMTVAGITAEAATVGKPSGLTVVSKGSGYVKLKWKKVKKSTGYQLYYSTKKNKGYKLAKKIGKGKTVTAKVTSLKPNKKYYFKVRAVKKKKKGKISKVVSAKTKKIPYQIPNCFCMENDDNSVWYMGDKIGNYYIYSDGEEVYSNENADDNRGYSRILVSDSSSKEGKPIVKTEYENGVFHQINSYISNGTTIIYSVNNYDYNNLSTTDVYSVSIDGKNNKKLFSADGYLNLVTYYKKVVYYNTDYIGNFESYDLVKKKHATINSKKYIVIAAEGKNLLVNFDDYSSTVYCYDVIKNKAVKISNRAYGVCFADGDIYFANLVYKNNKSKYHRYNIYSCSTNGKGKKLIRYTNWENYPYDDDDDKYVMLYKNGFYYYDSEDHENLYYFNIKTKKTTVIYSDSY